MYLIEDNNEEAFEILVRKYKILIAKKVSEYNVKMSFEDYFQEGLIVLIKSIDKYDSFYGNFFNFFLKNLVNRFNTLKKIDLAKPVVIDDVDFLREHKKEDEDLSEVFDVLNEFERKIVYLKYIKKLNAKEIEDEYFISPGKVYYTIRVIKEKLRRELDR